MAHEASLGSLECGPPGITPNQIAPWASASSTMSRSCGVRDRELGGKRVFILDWDVHHGNRIAEAFHRAPMSCFRIYSPVRDLPRHRPDERFGVRPWRGLHDQPSRRGRSEEFLWLSLIEHILLRHPGV